MKTKLYYNLIFFLSLFPLWITKFKFQIEDYIILFFLISVLFILHNLILKYLNKKSLLFTLYISIILTWGIDNGFSFFNDLIAPNEDFVKTSLFNIYFGSLTLFIVIFIFNFLIVSLLKNKGTIIVSCFIASLFLFNLLDNSKSYKNIPSFNKETVNLKSNKIKVILILDEMGGVKSFESKTKLGKYFDSEIKYFTKKHNLKTYNNVYSICPNSLASVTKTINNDYSNEGGDLLKKNFLSGEYFKKNCEISEYQKLSDKFYTEYHVIKNKLFDKFKSISVYQGMHIDYCLNGNVTKCEQFNQFKKRNYIKGFKNTTLTRLAGGAKLNGSITGLLMWRVLLQYRLIDSFELSSGEKASFLDLLKNVEKDIASKKYDLVFAHSLVPHRPYGFNSNCNYDGSKSIGTFRLIDVNEKVKRHNVDRICILKFLDNFLINLSKNDFYKDLEIFIFSDHGARIIKTDADSYLKNIFFYKDATNTHKVIEEEKYIQEEFWKVFFKKN